MFSGDIKDLEAALDRVVANGVAAFEASANRVINEALDGYTVTLTFSKKPLTSVTSTVTLPRLGAAGITVSQVSALTLQVKEGLSPDQAVAFDHYEPGGGDKRVCWASKVINGVTVIVFPGSHSFWDWERDLRVVTDPFQHDTLGPLHPGVFIGVPEAFAEIQAQTTAPRVLAGFSLGAGRALDLTGLLTVAGIPPLACVTFGSLKPGFQQLADVIGKVPQWSYRNGDADYYDLITEYPILPPPENYVHTSPLIKCTAKPTWEDRLERVMFCYHVMELYAEATSGITEVIA
jgi:hypothetical protein